MIVFYEEGILEPCPPHQPKPHLSLRSVLPMCRSTDKHICLSVHSPSFWDTSLSLAVSLKVNKQIRTSKINWNLIGKGSLFCHWPPALYLAHLNPITLSHFPLALSPSCYSVCVCDLCPSSPPTKTVPSFAVFPLELCCLSVLSRIESRLRGWVCAHRFKGRETQYSATVWRETQWRKRRKLALQSALQMTFIRKFWIVSLWMLHKLEQMLHFTSLGLKKKLNTVCIQQQKMFRF